jgi:4-amino-4-deoxy-L-arabinose transferase-like glycosyltransferase
MPKRGWLAVAALLALHFALAVWAVSHKSVTADEILHVTGGYLFNRYGDFRIQPENGVLPQRWAALPANLLDAPPPPITDNIYWRTSEAQVIGYQFFYETGRDHWPLLMAGRAMIALFSVGTGLLVFCWARRLFGTAAGFFSLSLYALCPNVLAHAALTTSDTAAVFFLLASVGAFWRHLTAPSWSRNLLSALVFALACVSKFSAVLLLPMMALLLAWRIAREPAATRSRWWRLAAEGVAAHVGVTVFVIWAFYGFRYSAFAPGLPPADHFLAPWEHILPYIGFQGKVVNFLREWQLLPEPFLYGYSWVVWAARARSAFLAGEYSIFGWVSFFPLTFFWKTPVAVLGALAVGGFALGRRWKLVRLEAVAPLLALFGVYWAFSLASNLNIGHRHILPTYPVLFIWLGGLLAPGVLAGLWRWAVPGVVVAGQLAANVRVAPDYLSFFNTFAGGPANGYRLLVDSSLDWGQDLPALRQWLQAHNPGPAAQPVYLAYFGAGEPSYYHIEATRMPFINGFKLAPTLYYDVKPGLYCVGATMLSHVYSNMRGAWTLEHERKYQEGRAKEPLFREYARNPAIREELARQGVKKVFEDTWIRYDQLRFARLCHYLRARQPDGQPGYSILVYRLDQAEIDAALNGSASDLARAIEGAAQRKR